MHTPRSRLPSATLAQLSKLWDVQHNSRETGWGRDGGVGWRRRVVVGKREEKIRESEREKVEGERKGESGGLEGTGQTWLVT